MAADPKTSAGARLERDAFRKRLRRRLAQLNGRPSVSAEAVQAVEAELQWVLGRLKRYGEKRGGLGK